VAERTRLLEREMAQGRLRAEFTYAFGRILSEGAAPVPIRQAPDAGPDPLAPLWEAPPPLDLAWLDRFFEANGPALRSVVALVRKFAATRALAPARNPEILAALQRIAGDSYALPALRQEASAALASPTHVNEFAGVVTILLNGLDEWAWPADGFPLRAI